jgi:hypothetical protein
VINDLPLLFQHFISQAQATIMHLRPGRHMLISSLLLALLLGVPLVLLVVLV